MSNEAAEELEKLLHRDIPITHAMGISVKAYDGHELTLRAPLSKNINHKMTAFGGSINTLTTLTCWGLIHLILREADLNAHVVIQDSSVRYLHPIHGDMEATCQKPPQNLVKRFLELYKQRGKARLELSSTIYQGDEIAASYIGRYVALQHPRK